ncbi:dihydropyrimidinase [Pectinatus brassicae]|uniref:Dihydropyrimidinase n=1 Tax=Pectinatus brassicae TaxID=862415 RepID=A0A840UGN8_9FIRM|nr:dihydropyrimidinase [Pectinatus brassicae]MBB5336911.1 dihydropyrimidinase [Pectinatus brassicae]
MEFIIKGGTIITSTSSYAADVYVKDGKIAAIGKNLPDDGIKIIDASGKYILPGAIDAHTHLEFPFNGTMSADDYFAGTRAAACGGVTTVFDFVTQKKGQGIREAVKPRNDLCAPKACVDYSFHVALTDLTDDVLEEFSTAADAGLPSYKLFMVYKKDGLMMNDADIYKALQRSKETGTLIAVHAENPDVIDLNIDKFKKEGKLSPWYHYLSRPEAVEAEADIRAIHWAKTLDAPLYIVHLANAQGMQAVKDAVNEGYEIYAETCPQYLNFTSDVYKREDGRNFVCSPPIKGKESQIALWQGIEEGYIDTVATDHCPFKQEQKDWGKDDFTKIPNGCMGVENLYPYMLSQANKGIISFQKAVELCAENPARIFGCTEKGAVEVGKDADIAIYDPNIDFTITNAKMHSDCDYTIWEGTKLQGYITATYVRGQQVFKDGKFIGEAGFGKFIKCQPRPIA